MRKLMFVVSVALAVVGCSKPAEPAKPALTQRQKDSILGQSTVPGARGVQRALSVQDSLNKRTRNADSIGGDTLR